MKTLVIYDETGYVFSQQSSPYRKPVGIEYLELQIPLGKVLVSVNTQTKEPVYADVPKNDLELIKEENYELKLLIAEMYEHIQISEFNKQILLAELVEMLLEVK